MNLSTATGPNPSGNGAAAQAMFDHFEASQAALQRSADVGSATDRPQSQRPPVVISFKRPTLHLKSHPAR